MAALLAGCASIAHSSLGPPVAAKSSVADEARRQSRSGLGVVLTSKDFNQIFGYDLDQSGTDAVLATGATIETFDQNTGKILKSFPKKDPKRTSYSMNAISTGDVALVTRYVVPKGMIYAKRSYELMNPVISNKFTGPWTPPVKDIQVEQMGPNQVATLTALYAIELKHADSPILIVSDVAKNSFSRVLDLPLEFSLGTSPQMAQDTKTNQAVFAYSPDGGARHGDAPVNALINMKTGKITQFNGLNNGYYHAGSVNGVAVDPATGIAATDTELNAQVEFYDLAKQSGTAAQLPCTSSTDQAASGEGIVNDPVNGLFLVTEPEYCSTNGGAIIVYDEKGDLVETITGFNMAIAEPAPVINPSKRVGWVLGPHLNQLQQFFY
jgi:hypothetical protein